MQQNFEAARDREQLTQLAELLRQYEAIGDKIARLISRPVALGHLGEFVASRIFRIELAVSATEKGLDGRFLGGPLAGRTVNVKWYGKREGMIGLDLSERAEYYLVLTGPKSTAVSSRGATRPWCIVLVRRSPVTSDVPRAQS